MDKHQQVFWTDINLRHKNKCPKKKTINTNGIICLRQNSKIPFQTKFPFNMVNNKMAKRIWNWYFIYQFHHGPFMSLNWYPVCLQNDHKQTKNGDSHAIWRQTIQTWRNMRHVTPLSSHDKNQKFLNDTRETSLLTALLFSQFVLSSCLRTAHFERLCC